MLAHVSLHLAPHLPSLPRKWLCGSCSSALYQVLCVSALRNLVCASYSVQVALHKCARIYVCPLLQLLTLRIDHADPRRVRPGVSKSNNSPQLFTPIRTARQLAKLIESQTSHTCLTLLDLGCGNLWSLTGVFSNLVNSGRICSCPSPI